jgi:hypothetical protein
MAYAGFFTSDRAQKYGWGLPRLLALTLLSFELAPRLSAAVAAPGDAVVASAVAALGLRSYLASGRWLAHLYVGSIGAVRLTSAPTSLFLKAHSPTLAESGLVTFRNMPAPPPLTLSL